MHRILMFTLLAVFALLCAFVAFIAEAPLTPDAIVQPALTVEAEMPTVQATMLYELSAVVGDLETVSSLTERSEREYTDSLVVALRDLMDSHETTAVGRSGRNGIWPGGENRLI